MNEQAPEKSGTRIDAERSFDAFISYSRDDVDFGRALEKALQKFRPPKGMGLERRRLRVFRDESDLVGTHYPDAISGFLRRSKKLVLVCSPSARDSGYVGDEIVKFARAQGANNIVPVLYRGRPNSEFKQGEEDDRAFPAALDEFMEEPLATDYRGFQAGEFKPNQGQYRNAWYTLLANLFDVGREDIERRDFRRQRRERIAVVSIVSVVIASLATFGTLAYIQKLRADEQRNLALSGLAVNLAAKSADLLDRQPVMSALVAAEAATVTDAAERTPVPEARQALRNALSALAGPRLSDVPDDVIGLGFDEDNGIAYAVAADGLRRWPLRPDAAAPDTAVTWSSTAAAGTAAVAVSENGQWLAAVSIDLTTIVNIRAADAARTEAAGFPLEVSSARVSNDGRWILITTKSEALSILDLRRGDGWQTLIQAPPESVRYQQRIIRFGFGPGATAIHVVSGEQQLRFFSLGDQVVALEPKLTIDDRLDFIVVGRQRQPGPQKLAVREDSNLFALAHKEQPLAVHALSQEGIEKIALGGDDVGATSVIFRPDLGLLFAVLNSGDALLWRTDELDAAPAPLSATPFGSSTLYALSPDGSLLAVGSGGSAVRLWNLQRPDRRPATLETGQSWIERLLIAPDSRYLVAMSEMAVSILDLADYDDDDEDSGPLTLRYPSAIRGLAISADSRWLLTTDSDAVRLTDLASPFVGYHALPGAVREPELDMEQSRTGPGFDSLRRMSGTPYAGLPSAGAFSPDGRWFATIGAGGEVLLADRSDRRAAPRRVEGIDTATAVAFDRSGQWLAAGGIGEDVLVWNTEALAAQPLTLTRAESAGKSSVAKLAFSADGRWLAAGAAFGEVSLWDWSAVIESGSGGHDEPAAAMQATALAGHEGWVLSIDFSHDGELLVTAGERAAQAWTPADADAPLGRLEIPLGYSQARSIPGKREVVTGGSDGIVRLWRVDDPDAAPVELRGHESSIVNIAVQPQGELLATAGEDGSVLVWRLDQPGTAPMREVGTRGTNAVAFLASGELVTSGFGPTLLWNLADLSEPPVVMPGSHAPAYWMGVSPSEDALGVVSRDGVARIWPLGTERLIDVACRFADANLAHGIWRDAYGDKPYEKTCDNLPVHPTLVRAGKDLAETGEVVQAIALLTRASELDPGLGIDPRRLATDIAVEAMLERGKRLAKGGKVIAASVQFERAKALQGDAVGDPTTYAHQLGAAQIHLREAEAFGKKGRYEQAVAKFITAKGVDPEIDVDPVAAAAKLVVPVWLGQARDTARNGNIDRAIELYGKVIELDPERDLDPVTEANRHAAWRYNDLAKRAAERGEVDTAVERFEKALELDPTLTIDPVSEARRLAAPRIARRAVDEIEAGRIDEGLAQLRDATLANPEMEITAECWNMICWHGVLWNRPAAVAEACERAVAMAPEDTRARIRDSRGVMRALQGELVQSKADFEAYVAALEGERRYEDRVAQRREWIAALQNGRNPITDEELARLRAAGQNMIWMGRCTK